ncbi:MAG: FtsX-like permease family protein [Lachnospiraceae bacterium]|nr:FtsX-like permease family protein [Lachnospiraceae bacterium]
MIRSILKKDLKRKKTMNIIILMFVMLATMFVASSMNNIITVMNGTGYYFEKAGIGDYVILTMGEDVIGNLDAALEDNPYVDDYRLETVIYVSDEKITREDGSELFGRNVNLIQSLDSSRIHFFDENNKEVTTVAPGKVYITSDFLKRNNLKKGDKIIINHGGVKVTFSVEGRIKDALLGSKFMGNARFLMNQEDFDKFAAAEELSHNFMGQVCYIDTDDVKGLNESLSDVQGMAFNKPIGIIKTCYVMDMIVAGVLVVLSICLIIVAFVVLKFTITFTLEEEFREIGVMKAIGIKDKKIRRIYITKYFAIAVVGALVGFAGSIPFGNMLMESVSENMVLGNSSGILLNVISAVVVVVVIVGYAYHCTKKLKKYSPIDAIRSGQTGERFKKKSSYRLGKSHLKPTGYMAVNDVISSPKRYITMIVAFAICSLLVFMLVNTTETMQSDNLVYTFGKVSDAYMSDNERAMEDMHGEGKTAFYNRINELEGILADNGIEATASIEAQFTCKVEFDGKSYKVACQQGINTKATDYVYSKGTAPSNAHEIAITKQISKDTGAKIGDTVKITVDDKTEEYLVTAYFQTMNQMGEIIRFHEDVQTNAGQASSMMAYQFDFAGDPSQKEIDEKVSVMREIFDTDDVFNSAEYTADCIGVVDTMKAVEYLILTITLIVVLLVTILMERSFISDEKGEIAILKAVGFSDKSIIKWHALRFAIVGVLAVAIAVAISIPMTKLCITPIFGIMGMSSIVYEFDLLKICVIFPGIILGVTLVAAGFTACLTKSINCRDTASIE